MQLVILKALDNGPDITSVTCEINDFFLPDKSSRIVSVELIFRL